MTPCTFCKQLTNRTYRSTRLSNNLISCCKPCADKENSKGKPYLAISLIFKPSNQE